MRKIFFFLLILSSACFSEPDSHQELISKTIPLSYIAPDKIIPALKPLLKPYENITSFEQTIIVNVNPETLTKIRIILHQLDLPPTVFLVSVHQDNANWTDDSSEINYSTNSAQTQGDNQSVSVSNGSYAYIATGSNFPVISQVDVGWATGVGYERMQAQKGILIQPSLAGNRVKLTIKRFYSNQNLINSQNIDNQQGETSTLIPMNKWVNLMQMRGQQQNSDDNLTYETGGGSENKGTLYIKVSIIKN